VLLSLLLFLLFALTLASFCLWLAIMAYNRESRRHAGPTLNKRAYTDVFWRDRTPTPSHPPDSPPTNSDTPST